jgi:hypothetical protein
MIGSSSFNPQLKPQKPLHGCVHPTPAGERAALYIAPVKKASDGASPHAD